MDREKISLSGVRETMLATLYLRAAASRAADPLLVDREAEQVVRHLDYDFRRLGLRPRDVTSIAIRVNGLDRWVREHLAAHPDTTVLSLGCGLDSRVYRVDPPATVQWYDVDFPDVIELRRRLLPERQGHHLIASSVTDPHLLDAVPGDRPVLVVAEGLMMYLSERDGTELLRRIVAHFPSGEIMFDALSRWGVRVTQRFSRPVVASGAHLEWAIDDPHDLERSVPGLVLDTEGNYFTAPELSAYPPPARPVIRAIGTITALRRMGRPLRYRFG